MRKNMEPMKVPLSVGWLSEQRQLLRSAAALLGYEVVESTNIGHTVVDREGKLFSLLFEDSLMFTVAQLLELGFEPGEFQYCPDCKRLQADCDAEWRWLAEHNETPVEKGER